MTAIDSLPAAYRRWLAFGTGVGIAVSGRNLEIAAARVRPSGIELLGAATIPNFRERAAAEWGAEYAAFLKDAGEGSLSATVLLPRGEIIVRHLNLPGVAQKDLEAAIALQLEALHPYGEDDIVWGWSPLAGGAVLVGIARRELTDRYRQLFTEAGVAVSSLTFSAAAIHAAVRVLGEPPEGGFLTAFRDGDAGSFEIYGESPARPVFTAEFEQSPARAVALAAAELRLPPETGAAPLEQVLPAPRAGVQTAPLPYATALAGACPLLSRAANLLPAEQRESASRARWAPTAVLAAVLAATLLAALLYSSWADRRYLRKLEAEIARLEPQALQAAALDRRIGAARNRARLLDEFRRRTQADLDALNELTRLLPPPIWTSSMDLLRDTANINGEAERAAGLIKVIDASPLFERSDFTVLNHGEKNETFRITTSRREGRK